MSKRSKKYFFIKKWFGKKTEWYVLPIEEPVKDFIINQFRLNYPDTKVGIDKDGVLSVK